MSAATGTMSTAAPSDVAPPLLTVDRLTAGYGESQILTELTFNVPAAGAVCLLGRTGVGKTTALKSIVGLIRPRAGRVIFDGQDVTSYGPHQRARLGVGYVPQGRGIFPHLSVFENLLMGFEANPKLSAGERSAILDEMYALFPVLAEMRGRAGGMLSGGQQQQLAIARALVARPAVLLLDEPTEGVQPSIIKEIARTLNALRSVHGFAMVLSEQVLSFAIEIADRFLILDKGEIAYEGLKADVDTAKIHAHLTV